MIKTLSFVKFIDIQTNYDNLIFRCKFKILKGLR